MIHIKPITEYGPAEAHVAAHMRATDVAEMAALSQVDPATAIRQSIAASNDAYTAFDGDTPVAVLGSAWATLGRISMPWMLGTDEMDDLALPIIRLSRRYVAHLRSKSSMLFNLVHAENDPSIRYLRALGFDLSPAYSQPNGAQVHLFRMRGERNV